MSLCALRLRDDLFFLKVKKSQRTVGGDDCLWGDTASVQCLKSEEAAEEVYTISKRASLCSPEVWTVPTHMYVICIQISVWQTHLPVCLIFLRECQTVSVC